MSELNLNHPQRENRLAALKCLADQIERGELPAPERGEEVNNHIHTIYSFSPYSPANAVWLSYKAGLMTSGLMDHDSISGAEEFIQAGRIIGLATTIGVECRCDFADTPLAGRRINNPDQKSVAYVALHGIPHTQIERVKAYFRPLVAARNERNRLMVQRLNDLLVPWSIHLDFEQDVVPLSMAAEQGSITERHILFALVQHLLNRFGRGQRLAEFLERDLRLPLNAVVRGYLLDPQEKTYAYDVLGALKSELVSAFYIDAQQECPDIRELITLGRDIGAITAYAYLGDIGKSVTGDKKAQAFEDSYLELLFDTIKELGFQAVTYMPTRNTKEQLQRVQSLCADHNLFQISGIDINTPRQAFNCPLLRRPEFRTLIDSTWALIGHEQQATEDLEAGMFSPGTIARVHDLHQRIEIFRKIGLQQLV